MNFTTKVELIIKINKLGKYIATEFAHRYYDEIGLGIDVTARDLQAVLKAKGLPWEKAKAFHNSAIVSPVFLPKTGFEDIQNINFSLLKNGQKVQDGNTADMLWKIDELISYISIFYGWKKGGFILPAPRQGVG